MTTSYFDLLSTPGRKEGCSFSAISGNGITAATATPIPADTGWTVVLVTISAGNTAVILPSNMSIGDIVEIYCTNPTQGQTGNAFVFPPSGEAYGFNNFTNYNTAGANGVPLIVRKITSTQWQILSAA